MMASIIPVPTPRSPLRLHVVDHGDDRPGPHGFWWPQSRVLDTELADLVESLPRPFGRVLRAVYSMPDWDEPSECVLTTRGTVKAVSYPGDDTHLMQLLTWDLSLLTFVVIHPDAASFDSHDGRLACLRG